MRGLAPFSVFRQVLVLCLDLALIVEIIMIIIIIIMCKLFGMGAEEFYNLFT